MGHIVILVHRHHGFDDGKYFLHAIAEIWKEQGWTISVQKGPGPRVKADIAALHVDLTVVPEDHLEWLRQYPIVINGAVADISKRAYSANLVTRGDGYAGPVIIKTNCNFAGRKEAQLVKRGFLPISEACVLEEYPVLPSQADVMDHMWAHPGIIVERFLAEQRDGFYCLRTWMFLGDKETNSLSYSREPVVKASNVIRREVVAEVPEDLRAMRRAMGFDFGKFDYAVVDGKTILYDANRTPSRGNFPREQYLPRVRVLADGLHALAKGIR